MHPNTEQIKKEKVPFIFIAGGEKTMKQAVFVKPLTVSFPRELYSAIRRVSDERFISMAQVVREIVEEAFSESANAERFNQAEGEIRQSGRKE
jgi:hypothetical protein